MDHGKLTDNNGVASDFRHVVLIMTSNVGARDLARASGSGYSGPQKGNEEKAFKDLFSPEFRNRLDAKVGFNPLDPSVVASIVDKFIGEASTPSCASATRRSRSPSPPASGSPRRATTRRWALARSRALFQNEVKKRLTDVLLFGSSTTAARRSST